jgi:class 3 adenylate cyclase
MAKPHKDTITFLFTDVEGSTSLWEKNPEAMSEALYRHDEILRTAIEAHNGQVFKTVGDAFHAVFSTAPHALRAALEAQRTLVRGSGPKQDPFG